MGLGGQIKGTSSSPRERNGNNTSQLGPPCVHPINGQDKMMLYIGSGDTPPSILEPREFYVDSTKEKYDGQGGVEQ